MTKTMVFATKVSGFVWKHFVTATMFPGVDKAGKHHRKDNATMFPTLPKGLSVAKC